MCYVRLMCVKLHLKGPFHSTEEKNIFFFYWNLQLYSYSGQGHFAVNIALMFCHSRWFDIYWPGVTIVSLVLFVQQLLHA